MRNLRSVLFFAILLAACISMVSPVYSADRYYPGDRASTRDTRTGVVLSVVPHVLKLVVAFSDDERSQVFAKDAHIFSGSRTIRFGDLRVGDRIRIDGAIRSTYVMDAYRIDVIGHTDIGDYNRGGDRDRDRGRDDDRIGRNVSVSGRVTSVDTRRGKIVVSDRNNRFEILTGRNTDIREDGRSRSIRDINDGDYVTVNGRTESTSTISAYSININSNSGSRYGDRYERSISGEVIKDSSTWSRDIAVRTASGDRTVQIPKGVTILRGRDGISVHDINKGDFIRADGRWEGSKFVASRVDVSSGRGGYDNRDRDTGYFGRIDRIDRGRREFRLRVERNEYRISANYADIIDDDGSRISFNDLRDGQTVWVRGAIRDGRIYADRIELGSYYNNDRRYRPGYND